MQQEGLLSTRGYSKSRRRRRRGAQALPPARRQRGLRLDGAHGPGLLAALPARRRPGQLRLDRRRPAGRLPLHRGAPHARSPRRCCATSTARRSTSCPNFDGAHAWSRSVLPARFPNLLANGSSGIAVGMATNVPPHNLRELVDALHARGARTPTARSTTCSRRCPGPDFPTGAIICGTRGHPRRLRHRPRPAHRARARRVRDEQARRADRRHRDPVHGEQGVDAGADRRARARGQDRRRRRPARRVQPRRACAS